MTMAVGFRSLTGVVPCTDSLESDGFTKRNVNKSKLLMYGQGEWGVAIAGAGGAGIIDKFLPDAVGAIHDKTRGVYSQSKIEETIEKTLGTYIRKYKSNPFRVLVAIFNRMSIDDLLYRNDDNCLTPIRDYVHVGVGASLWGLFVETLYHQNMTTQECAALGIFILAQAKEYVGDVGGPTRVVVHERMSSHPGWRQYTRQEIAEVEAKVSSADLAAELRRYWRERFKLKRHFEDLYPPDKSKQ